MFQTDQGGKYALSSADPGQDYLIMAKRNSQDLDLHAADPAEPNKREAIFAPIFFPGTANVETAQTIRVEAGKKLTDLDIKLKKSQPRCATDKRNVRKRIRLVR
jgi:hypothetical protein